MTAWHVIGVAWSLAALLIVASVVAGGVRDWAQRRRDVQQARKGIGVLGITVARAADGTTVYQIPAGVDVHDAVDAVLDYQACEAIAGLPTVEPQQ